MREPDDFFEEDEPLEEVLRAYDAGPKARTARPMGQTVTFDVIGNNRTRGWTNFERFAGILGDLIDRNTTATPPTISR